MQTNADSLTQAAAGQKLISASLLRLRMKAPFFATLALFTKFIPTYQHSSAATDGKDIYYNPDFLSSLRSPEQDGLLLHEVLHAALLHPIRRGTREGRLWNIAADIVVNGIIAQQSGFGLPKGGLRDSKLEKLSVEEVYELLQQETGSGRSLTYPDLLESALAPPFSESSDLEKDCSNKDRDQTASGKNESDSESGKKAENLSMTARKADIESHWKQALQQATLIARTTQQGTLPAGIERELGQVTAPQLNWRTYLWRYLVQTPTDFQGFDRRFVHQGLYLEALQGESVRVYLCIDTSGSIDNKLLRLFFSEVRGILSAYPHLKCELYYADADIYGPYELENNSKMPTPKGGGGTSFEPFFYRVSEQLDGSIQGVCIYLTDGYGTFPASFADLPVLWVVTPGGLPLEQFPFGEAVRLLSA